MEKEKQIEQPNSVEVSVNAKGQYSGKVKVYSESIKGAFDLAVEYSTKLEELIKGKNGSL